METLTIKEPETKPLKVIKEEFYFKLSFDFDETLDRDDVQEYAIELMERGHEIHILTNRAKENGFYGQRWNDDIFKTALELDIPSDLIHFLDGRNKSDFFNENPEFLWHLDDSWFEVGDMRKNCLVPIIHVLNRDWKQQCEDLLNYMQEYPKLINNGNKLS